VIVCTGKEINRKDVLALMVGMEKVRMDNEFHFVDSYTGQKCHVCKRGARIDRQAFDVNAKGELCRVVAIREHNRERPGVITVGYLSCSNPRCPVHVDIGNRKIEDAKYLLKQIRAHAYKGRRRRRSG
jgi:hypothetical protein